MLDFEHWQAIMRQSPEGRGQPAKSNATAAREKAFDASARCGQVDCFFCCAGGAIQMPNLKFQLTFVGVLCFASAASANVLTYQLFKSETYQQTSNAQPTTPTAFAGAAGLLTSVPSDIGAAQLFVGASPTPIALNPLFPGSTTWSYSKSEPSASALNADFPSGTLYGFLISGGTLGSHTTTFSTPAGDLYPLQVPYLNGTGFSHLQGMDSTAPFSFTFDGFGPAAPGAVQALTRLGLYRVSNGQLDYANSVTNTATSLNMPANSLQPGTAYMGDLFYSDILINGVITGQAQIEYDLHTHFTFTTAAPEPGTAVLGAVAAVCLAMGCGARRRHADPAPRG